MKQILLAIACILTTGNVIGQTTKTYSGLENLPEDVKKEFLEKEHFKELSDSLFIAKQYDTLIQIAKSRLNKRAFSSIARYNLIAAFYMKNDIERSDSLLFELINSYTNYFEVVWLMSNSSIAMIQYLQAPSNRDRIVNYVIDHYKKENITKPEIGLELLRLYLSDQWTRRNSINGWANTDYSNQSFLADSKTEEKEVFALYQKTKSILSSEEIGKEMCLNQFPLPAHDGNLEHRAYYFPLIKKAAQNGICERTIVLNFILRTEMMQKGQTEFYKTLDNRIAELRKEYNLPDYSFGAF